MKVPSVKKLVENYSLEQLSQAEEAILDERTPSIEVEGSDDGEKLTHVMAAIWIKKDMQTGSLFPEALRKFTQKVRKSIS